ncbi:hypothetical protein FB45DRAFT_373418 [Roridomyces roridus]|uniref:F-box domain-containing protein n=1 Tax=Roridomyces roridus TaxID=1738132 RepID=A0AAD7B3H3_9AGAR|nr:hypothetical protein FB45DRAFT_373418 [Roridomyces roridus]
MTSRRSSCGTLRDRDNSAIVALANPITIAGVRRLVGSNQPPQPAEETYVRALLSRNRASEDRLTEEQSKLEARLKDIESERALLVEQREEHTPIISPLRRMPWELLAEIISWATLGCAGDDAVPWVLARVSHHWRGVALSHHSLWSTFRVEGGRINEMMLEEQIKRTQRIPLKIHFTGSDYADPIPQQRVFLMLANHSARWQELNLALTQALVPCLGSLQGSLPSLKRLRIQSAGVEVETQDRIDSLFAAAPNLVDFGIHHTQLLTLPPILTSQLTSYRVHGPWQIHQRVLELASKLVEARITLPRLDDDDDEQPLPSPASDARYRMDHLQRIHVSDVKILEHLVAPALAEISLYLEGNDAPLDCLSAFISRSSCTIRRLCLQGSPQSSITAEILNRYPSITNFALVVDAASAAGFGDSVDLSNSVLHSHFGLLDQWDVDLREAPIVSPQLTDICFATTDPISFVRYRSFLGMLQSRRRGPGQTFLRAATLLTSVQHPPDFETQSALDALQDAGLNLSVRYGAHVDVGWRINHLTYGTPWVF